MSLLLLFRVLLPFFRCCILTVCWAWSQTHGFRKLHLDLLLQGFVCLLHKGYCLARGHLSDSCALDHRQVHQIHDPCRFSTSVLEHPVTFPDVFFIFGWLEVNNWNLGRWVIWVWILDLDLEMSRLLNIQQHHASWYKLIAYSNLNLEADMSCGCFNHFPCHGVHCVLYWRLITTTVKVWTVGVRPGRERWMRIRRRKAASWGGWRDETFQFEFVSQKSITNSEFNTAHITSLIVTRITRTRI